MSEEAAKAEIAAYPEWIIAPILRLCSTTPPQA